MTVSLKGLSARRWHGALRFPMHDYLKARRMLMRFRDQSGRIVAIQVWTINAEVAHLFRTVV
jgi:hypothetical protein